MRISLALLPLSLCAAPAFAQATPATVPAIAIPPQLADPATADKLADAMQSMSRAFLGLKVGGVEAALEGRKPTRAERNVTVRDLARHDDPDFDRHFQQRIAAARPMIRQGMQALNEALPPMMEGLAQAQQSLERAIANMPDPNYPRR